jgi:hypothetical protein
LLSEAIDSVKQMKESLSQVNTEEEEEEVSS